MIDLNDLILNLIQDCKSQIQAELSSMQIRYNGPTSSNGIYLIKLIEGGLAGASQAYWVMRPQYIGLKLVSSEEKNTIVDDEKRQCSSF